MLLTNISRPPLKRRKEKDLICFNITNSFILKNIHIYILTNWWFTYTVYICIGTFLLFLYITRLAMNNCYSYAFVLAKNLLLTTNEEMIKTIQIVVYISNKTTITDPSIFITKSRNKNN